MRKVRHSQVLQVSQTSKSIISYSSEGVGIQESAQRRKS